MHWIFKTILFLVAVVVVGLIVVLMGDRIDGKLATKEKQILSTIGTEVLPNVFDDGQSIVYIKADTQWTSKEDSQLEDILNKKRDWEMKFPIKKVTAMSIVTGNTSGYGRSFIAGLLIQYEQRK